MNGTKIKEILENESLLSGIKRVVFTFFIFFSVNFSLFGQDAAYSNFAQNRFLFNPSLTGSYGAQSWKMRSKLQWNNDGGSGYKTISLLFEETMPCSIIDIGAKINYNEEGAGIYSTLEMGFLSSAFLPFKTGKFNDHNFKMGMDFSWGVNSIDFSRLIWSDQLDPKYGNINATTFTSPNDGRSSWYFNPGFGVSIRSLWNKKSPKAVMTNIGGALYRFYSVNDGEINQSVSVLGLKNSNPYRITAFFEAEYLPIYYNRKFMSVRPLLLFQKQGNLNYLETGLRVGYLKSAGLSTYYHAAPRNQYGQTQWLTFSTDFMIPVGKGKKMEMSLSYSENIGGLQNFVGPQFEIGISYHLSKSSICNLMGMEDDVPYNSEYICPIMAITPGKRKMYENIWYKN